MSARDPIDWSAVRARLQRLQIGAPLDVGEARRVLEQRARALAAPRARPIPHGELLEVATFRLAAERYAIESRWLREVVVLEDFTPVPGAPPAMLGVANLRGEIVLVVDLRRLFDVARRSLDDLARLFVLGEHRIELGILADEAGALESLPRRNLLPPPASITGIDRRLLLGVTRDALVVLDGAALLADPRLTTAADPARSANR